MENAAKNISLADYYFDLLRNLSKDHKLDLISKLSQSLKNDKEYSPSLDSLFGTYKSDESAEEIIEAIQTSRTFNRRTESF